MNKNQTVKGGGEVHNSLEKVAHKKTGERRHADTEEGMGDRESEGSTLKYQKIEVLQ